MKRFYLHTPPLLPSKVRFWEKRGVEVVHVKDDEMWGSTHEEMIMKL